MAELSEMNLPFEFKDFRKKAEELETLGTSTISFDDFDQKVDTDFSEFRKKFDTEIQKVEEEMARFRSELMDKDGNLLLSALSSQKTRNSLKTDGEKLLEISSNIPPYVRRQGKKKIIKSKSNDSKVKPDEVVSSGDEKLLVQEKQKQKPLRKRRVNRVSTKDVCLPKGVKPDPIRSILNKNTALTVDGQLPEVPKPRKTVAFK